MVETATCPTLWLEFFELVGNPFGLIEPVVFLMEYEIRILIYFAVHRHFMGSLILINNV